MIRNFKLWSKKGPSVRYKIGRSFIDKASFDDRRRTGSDPILLTSHLTTIGTLRKYTYYVITHEKI